MKFLVMGKDKKVYLALNSKGRKNFNLKTHFKQ